MLFQLRGLYILMYYWWSRNLLSAVDWLCSGSTRSEKLIIGCGQFTWRLFNLWSLTFHPVLFYRRQDGWGRQVQTATGGHCCEFYRCTTHTQRTFFWKKINPSADMRNICSGQSPKKRRAPNSESLRLELRSATCHSEKVVVTDIYIYSGYSCVELSVDDDERATFGNMMMFCATNIVLLQHSPH